MGWESMNAKDAERLARIRKGMEGRTRYEGQEERNDEFLLRVFDEAVFHLRECLEQACCDSNDYCDSQCLTAYAEGLRFFIDFGRFEADEDCFRVVQGKFKEGDE